VLFERTGRNQDDCASIKCIDFGPGEVSELHFGQFTLSARAALCVSRAGLNTVFYKFSSESAVFF
jgi:hypothetical protein